MNELCTAGTGLLGASLSEILFLCGTYLESWGAPWEAGTAAERVQGSGGMPGLRQQPLPTQVSHTPASPLPKEQPPAAATAAEPGQMLWQGQL